MFVVWCVEYLVWCFLFFDYVLVEEDYMVGNLVGEGYFVGD